MADFWDGVVNDAVVVYCEHNGVANRVMALAAFAILAEIYGNRPLLCCWVPNKHCESLPEQLFDRGSFYWQPLSQRNWDDTVEQFTKPRVCIGPWTVSLWHYFARPEITGLTRVQLEPRVSRYLRQLRPAERVRQKLEWLQLQWPSREYRIGLHVRRTDLKPANGQDHAIRNKLLKERLDRLVKEEPDAVWIAATDNRESLQWLCDRYGTRVRSTEPTWGTYGIRKTGATDTATDLFALSQCRRIIGTNSSTFSELAGRLCDIPVEYA